MKTASHKDHIVYESTYMKLPESIKLERQEIVLWGPRAESGESLQGMGFLFEVMEVFYLLLAVVMH